MKVSMSVVWDRTSEFLSERLAVVAGIAALAIFVPAVISESLAPIRAAGAPGIRLGLSVLALAFGLLSLWGQLAITALALDPGTGAAGARSLANRRMPAMVGVALALLILAAVLSLPVVLLLYASGVDLARMNQPGAMQTMSMAGSGFVLLYLLVLLPIGLFLIARFAVLLAPIVVAEGLVIGAFGRAFRLSRGITWRLIGVLLLYGIIMFVATLAAVTVAGAVFGLMFRGDGPVTIATVLTAIVSALVSAIFSVIGAAFCAKLYLAARAREDSAPA